MALKYFIACVALENSWFKFFLGFGFSFLNSLLNENMETGQEACSAWLEVLGLGTGLLRWQEEWWSGLLSDISLWVTVLRVK